MRPSLLTRAVRLATLAAVAAPASVFAGGFSLNEQSASAMGVANAGAAANPENATTVLFNPAGMSQLKGTNISFGAAVLDIDAEAKSASASNTLGDTVDGRTGGDIADPAVLPNFYLTHQVNDSIHVGFGIHAPYGLAADYDNNFAGRYFADKTELSVISFSPAISVNNGQGLSMGVGINVMYAEGKLTKFQDYSGIYGRWQQAYGKIAAGLPTGTTPSDLGLTAPSDFEQGYADIEGDDIAVNFRVGFLYELSDRTQFGLTAQTGTEFELKGDAEISGLPQTTEVDLGALGVQALPTGAQGAASEAVRVPLAIPESITVGARHQLTDTVTLLAGATYSKWSRFEELDIVSREGGTGPVSSVTGNEVITHITEKWKNTWQLNVGSIWQVTPEWALKAGYAWDESPVDNYLTARIPSSDRHWLTLGGQWKSASQGWTVDAAVGTLLFTDDPKVNEFSYQHDAPTQKDPSAGASNYKGEYELSAWSASIQVSKAF
ncbi:long-chain fatty acid transport protein [Marinobacter sp. LV10R510-11A]|uniref:OmpP1/FadL family transporter n=1 Tax=Marinobacter sp. LV10R510-11A TaxID=1415568 RepID=UPI000BB767C9|nr:outer membrane protein transport protein [Marinobacter sp. LV10R510-11A]SOB76853.1 long-chain fatty acid transport protein [Marinobacter sp. LV10R510-11A]